VVVDVSLLPPGGAATLASGRAELQEIRTDPLGASRGARVALPLEDVAPGQYLVRATVRSGREAVAEVLRDVVVAPGARPAAAAPPAPVAPDPAAVLEGEIARRYLGVLKGRHAGPIDTKALEGFAQFERRDYKAAATAWSQCLDAEPTNAAVAFLLGWAQAGAGDERAAIGAWRAAIVADSAIVPAYLALIDAYLRLGQPDLARQVAESGVRALPDSIELKDRLLRLGRRQR
jgi:tetratricopeptide (TPR) repeat protein